MWEQKRGLGRSLLPALQALDELLARYARMANSYRRRVWQTRMGTSGSKNPWCALVCLGTSLAVSRGVAADEFSVGGAFEDVKEYYTAPIRWDSEDWIAFGGDLSRRCRIA